MNTKDKKKKPILCTVKTCGDCGFYKYYSVAGSGCHLTPETGIVRKGPITKNCPFKVKISAEEQKKREEQNKALARLD